MSVAKLWARANYRFHRWFTSHDKSNKTGSRLAKKHRKNARKGRQYDAAYGEAAARECYDGEKVKR